MTKEQKVALLENRILVLEERGNKNIKAPGVLKSLRRELRNLKA